MAQMSCAEAQAAADDAWTTKVQPVLEPYVQQYRADHPTWWQGLRTHTTIPLLGVTAFPDIGLVTPSDQMGWPWPEAIRTTRLPMMLVVNCYLGDRGPGYEVNLYVDCATRRWHRCMAFGAEMWRNVDWHAWSLLAEG
jgi:hypothetical protein